MLQTEVEGAGTKRKRVSPTLSNRALLCAMQANTSMMLQQLETEVSDALDALSEATEAAKIEEEEAEAAEAEAIEAAKDAGVVYTKTHAKVATEEEDFRKKCAEIVAEVKKRMKCRLEMQAIRVDDVLGALDNGGAEFLGKEASRATMATLTQAVEKEQAEDNGELSLVRCIAQTVRADRYEHYADTFQTLLETACFMNDAALFASLLAHTTCIPTYAHLYSAAKKGCAAIVELILTDGRVDPSSFASEIFRNLSRGSIKTFRSNAAVIDLLLVDGRADPTVSSSALLYDAVQRNALGVVKALLKDGRADPTVCLSKCDTSTKESTEILKEILKDSRVNPSVLLQQFCQCKDAKSLHLVLEDERVVVVSNELLYFAISQRSIDIVQLLLKDGRIDPARDNSRCLLQAFQKYSHAIVGMLLADGRADPLQYDGIIMSTLRAGRSTDMVRTLLADARIATLVRASLPPSQSDEPLSKIFLRYW